MLLLGWDCQAGASCVGRAPAVCWSHLRPGPIGCHLPIMASDGVPPWTPSCHHQGRGHSLGFLSSRGSSGGRSSLCEGPGSGVQSAPLGKVETEEKDDHRQTKCSRGACEMRPGAAAVISVTGTRGTAARGSGCSADSF